MAYVNESSPTVLGQFDRMNARFSLIRQSGNGERHSTSLDAVQTAQATVIPNVSWYYPYCRGYGYCLAKSFPLGDPFCRIQAYIFNYIVRHGVSGRTLAVPKVWQTLFLELVPLKSIFSRVRALWTCKGFKLTRIQFCVTEPCDTNSDSRPHSASLAHFAAVIGSKKFDRSAHFVKARTDPHAETVGE